MHFCKFKLRRTVLGSYREGQEDLSSLPDWKLYGYNNEKEYAEYLTTQKLYKGDEEYSNPEYASL